MSSPHHYHSPWTLPSTYCPQLQDLSQVVFFFLLILLLHKYTLFRMCSYGYTMVHRKDLHLTKIVFTIVLVFLVLNLPRLVLGVYEISR